MTTYSTTSLTADQVAVGRENARSVLGSTRRRFRTSTSELTLSGYDIKGMAYPGGA